MPTSSIERWPSCGAEIESSCARQKLSLGAIRSCRSQARSRHGKPRVVFSHAGNAGDVIFSLPTLRVLSQGRPARLLLRTGSPAFYAEGVHPLGAVQLDAATVRMMTPLLEAQTYIESADVLGEADVVDCRLDLFRDAPLPGDKGSIARWYFYCFGVFADLSQPWLKVEPDTNYSDTIVISRSQRYRNPTLDHRVLARYPKLAFIGVDAEFDEMRALLPKLERVPVPDFLAMARAIAGARLFIGNQSLPYSIAEALKARRLLEACPRGTD